MEGCCATNLIAICTFACSTDAGYSGQRITRGCMIKSGLLRFQLKVCVRLQLSQVLILTCKLLFLRMSPTSCEGMSGCEPCSSAYASRLMPFGRSARSFAGLLGAGSSGPDGMLRGTPKMSLMSAIAADCRSLLQIAMRWSFLCSR